jgi:hypothetical protein
MTTTAAPPGQANLLQPVVPPDEQFWVRYSPHHEFPLSTVTSFALHVLVIGLLLLFAFVLIASKPVNQVPVEPVRLAGGGGKPHSVGDGPGHAGLPPVEDGAKPADNDNPPPEKPLALDNPRARPGIVLDDNDRRAIAARTGPTDRRALESLLDRLHSTYGPPQKPSPGQGGDGSHGGLGDGHGPGTGPGSGPGTSTGTLTQREKRMLRWTMHFNTNTGRDYLAQLAGLGAFIAIPVRKTDSGFDYELIREPQKTPAKMVKEDVRALNRIFWYESDPPSVRDMMQALGLTLRPEHFVAFMPQELEDMLFKLEREKAGSRPEDDILETHFRVRQEDGRYFPELQSIQFRR